MKRTKCERNFIAPRCYIGTAIGVNKLSKIAKKVLQILKDKQANIVLLTGELGSGKTTFTKFLAKELGIKASITSPTFLISKEYKIQKATCNMQHATSLIHYDLYRLRLYNELEEIGFWEKIADHRNLIIIEWPDKIKGLTEKISKQYKTRIIKINFFHTNNLNQRNIKIIV